MIESTQLKNLRSHYSSSALFLRVSNLEQSLHINGAEIDATGEARDALKRLRSKIHATVFPQKKSCSDPKARFSGIMKDAGYVLHFEGEEEVVWIPKIAI